MKKNIISSIMIFGLGMGILFSVVMCWLYVISWQGGESGKVVIYTNLINESLPETIAVFTISLLHLTAFILLVIKEFKDGR